MYILRKKVNTLSGLSVLTKKNRLMLKPKTIVTAEGIKTILPVNTYVLYFCGISTEYIGANDAKEAIEKYLIEWIDALFPQKRLTFRSDERRFKVKVGQVIYHSCGNTEVEHLTNWTVFIINYPRWRFWKKNKQEIICSQHEYGGQFISPMDADY